MTMTLNEAAKSCRKAKGTVLKAIKEGRLSAPKDTKDDTRLIRQSCIECFH